jgi:prolyl-tRNA editing enzyme YbaK/EbsC (Cys-tRNA(Pro) deacylase)
VTSQEASLSLASVTAWFAAHAPDITVITLETSTASVAEAAAGHGVSHAQIAKTLSLRVGERRFLLVTAGDARLDNKKAKVAFGGKVSMLLHEEALALTGHPIGGVCPFGLASEVPIYCDVSLKAHAEVVPAAGDRFSAVRIEPLRMAALVGAAWIDCCVVPGLAADGPD